MLSSINVKNYMTANLITFKPDMGVMDAIYLLLENRISAAPVVDKRGNLVGMLSEKDCMKVVLQASYHEERAGKVSEYMSRNVKTVNLDDSLLDVARMFLEAPYKRYPVMRDNVLVGQISRKDVLKALKDLW
ncbi:MAG: CBS domain-containing protein [Candidatus Competibacteraceae bacterium]|nr:CBS domain-containing protein [Candidatus Competibacteraceae bacterium]